MKIEHRSKLVQIIMSLSKIFAGRKKECGVWEYFEYDEKSDSSKCVKNRYISNIKLLLFLVRHKIRNII